MHADDLILVTGATGNTGSNLLQEPLEAGCRCSCDGSLSEDGAGCPNTSASVVVGNFTIHDLSRQRFRESAMRNWSRPRVQRRRRNRFVSQN